MGAELIYKTTNEYEVELWHALMKKVESNRQKRTEFMKKMTEEFGPSPKHRYSYRDKSMNEFRLLILSGAAVKGLDCGYDEEPPAGSGWRLDSKDHYWYPKLKEAAGKARSKELAALYGVGSRELARTFEVPEHIFGTGYLYSPGFTFDQDTQTLYLTWGSFECNAEMQEFLNKNPQKGWTEVPRSEWYAYVEAREAKKNASSEA